jgi:glycine dehydrogenase subunit 1
MGGPGVGLFACKMDFVRTTPGRLVGQTTDKNGNRSFVLTLAAREQHIRREKAVSNICTNSGHCALAAAMYMATAGKTGLRSVAQLNHDHAAYLKAGLEKAGFRPLFNGPFFNEFACVAPSGFESQHEKLAQKGFIAGLRLGRYFPEPRGNLDLRNAFLFCATEVHTKDAIDAFLQNLKGVA